MTIGPTGAKVGGIGGMKMDWEAMRKLTPLQMAHQILRLPLQSESFWQMTGWLVASLYDENNRPLAIEIAKPAYKEMPAVKAEVEVREKLTRYVDAHERGIRRN